MVYSSKLKKIIITGSNSRFCKFLKKDLRSFDTEYPNKKIFNITNFNQMDKHVRLKGFTHLIHIAGLSRPMAIHDENIIKSIDLNIIGTANIVKLCKKNNIKLIYFSTNYVYPGTKGNYKETSNLKPINNYAWSKLGGESSVQLYKNSLILRLCITDYPFTHKKAIKGATSSFLYNKFASEIVPHLLDEFGILNLGGESREIYKFANLFSKKKIKYLPINQVRNFPLNSSIDITKLKKILQRKNIKLSFKF
jgi:dTDP-4-dehydrorhamnose reductase